MNELSHEEDLKNLTGSDEAVEKVTDSDLDEFFRSYKGPLPLGFAGMTLPEKIKEVEKIKAESNKSEEKSELALKIEKTETPEDLEAVLRSLEGTQEAYNFHNTKQLIGVIDKYLETSDGEDENDPYLVNIPDVAGLKNKVRQFARQKNIQTAPKSEIQQEPTPQPIAESVPEPVVIEPELVEPKKYFFGNENAEGANLAKSHAMQWYVELPTNEKLAIGADLYSIVEAKGLEESDKIPKEREIKMMAKNIAPNELSGVGKNILKDLAENLVMEQEVPNNVLAPGEVEVPALVDHKLPSRKGFGGVLEKSEKPANIVDQDTPLPVETVPNMKVNSEERLKELFTDPSVVKHKVVSGSRLWQMLQKTLENNEKFRSLSGTGTAKEITEQVEAKKTRVLQALVGEVLANSSTYGLGPNGEMTIGQEVDFTDLFSEKVKLEKLIDEAENLKPAQISSIVSNNNKIETWVSANPDKPINVDEILNTKPKVTFEPNELVATPEPVPVAEPEIKVLHRPELFTPKDQKPVYTEGSLSEEVAKQRTQADRSMAQNKITPIDNRGLRTMAGDVSYIESSVKGAFEEEVNNVYGKEGVLGFGKVKGIDSKDWGYMARLPAPEVVKYYTGDSTGSGLPADVIETLAKSKNHNLFMKQMIGLMEQAGGAVKPAENENVQDFIKRLGGYVMRVHIQNMQSVQKPL